MHTHTHAHTQRLAHACTSTHTPVAYQGVCVCVCVCMRVYFTMVSKKCLLIFLFSLFPYKPMTCNVLKCFESLKVLCKFAIIIIIIYIHLYKCRRDPNTNFNLVFWSYFFFSQQVNTVFSLKCWGAWDSTCEHKAKNTRPEAKATVNTDAGQCGLNPTPALETYERQKWRNF